MLKPWQCAHVGWGTRMLEMGFLGDQAGAWERGLPVWVGNPVCPSMRVYIIKWIQDGLFLVKPSAHKNKLWAGNLKGKRVQGTIGFSSGLPKSTISRAVPWVKIRVGCHLLAPQAAEGE